MHSDLPTVTQRLHGETPELAPQSLFLSLGPRGLSPAGLSSHSVLELNCEQGWGPGVVLGNASAWMWLTTHFTWVETGAQLGLQGAQCSELACCVLLHPEHGWGGGGRGAGDEPPTGLCWTPDSDPSTGLGAQGLCTASATERRTGQ